MVRTWASLICGSEPGKNWSADFKRRHESILDCRYLNTLDLERHKAESEPSSRQSFNILREKMNHYSIQPQNCYNMDEKGFLIGHLQKVQRIFPKALMKQQNLLGAGQDGSREWITLIATICADGSSPPPALIYKAVSGDLQDTWLQDYIANERPCWFASSPNGWTSGELGLSWLQSLFDTQTIDKAKRDWRLLILDGHGSHCTLRFLDWCRSNRIIVAIFPPHSTHRSQPLDVSLFRPLATYYSQQLDHHTRLSQGLIALTKRDFFKNFYSAYDRAFTEDNIKSGWHKTGLEPFDPEQVLKIFNKEEPEDEDAFPDHALKKAGKQQQKEAKEAQKQLETKSKASSSRPRKEQKSQEPPKKPRVAVIVPEPQVASNHLKSRSGRTIKKPTHLDDICIDSFVDTVFD
jgi:hypothetical protein